MLCYRNCGLESTYINYKGLPCCSKSHNSCPAVALKKSVAQKGIAKPSVSKALAGRNLDIAHRNAISKGLLNSTYSPSLETISRIKESNKLTKSQQNIVAWNKGLDRSDPRVAAYSNKQKGTKRASRIKKIDSSDPIYNDFKKYRNRIAVRTGKTYLEFRDEINPSNLPIGKAGVAGAHHIDHIMSVCEAFKYSIPIELMAAKENLRVIPWKENNSKYSKVDYALVHESIKQFIKERI